MKRRLIAGLVLSALLLSSCTGTPIQHTVDLNARGAELAQTLCNQYGALSARFSLFQDGVEIASGGAAQGGVPVGNALYLIGSVGKTYVAAAAMRTEKEEKEGFLHRRVAEMMDGFSMEDERYASITPAMLLEHSAGFLGVGSKDRYLLDRAPVWRRAAEQL